MMESEKRFESEILTSGLIQERRFDAFKWKPFIVQSSGLDCELKQVDVVIKEAMKTFELAGL
jgi:hypothetical protein